MTQDSTTSFKGQIIFIGIDVHKSNWVVTERHAHLDLKTYSGIKTPKELVERLRRLYPDAVYKSVYEAGFCGFWIHEELKLLGVDNIVINASDVPTSEKERIHKNDVRDSKKLARELENGSLAALYIPCKEHLELRDLVRRETQLVRNLTRVDHRLRSYFARYGLSIPSGKISGYTLKVLWQKSCEISDYTLRSLVEEIVSLRQNKLEVINGERQLLTRQQRRELQSYLMSLPGVGFRTAVVIQSELWDINRFPDPAHLLGYCGFSPRLVGSGDGEKMRGNGKRKNGLLHSMLIESAWVAISKDMELRVKYGQLSARLGPSRAISVIAKKLLLRAQSVWLRGSRYQRKEIA